MGKPTAVLGLALLFSLPAAAADPEGRAPRRIPIADGVFLFVTPPYGEVGLDGNSVVILSRDGVLVFDSNGTPAAAAAVLAEIRRMTDEPVRYVVNSHWHWDHWYGTEVYRQAFPGVTVVAQRKTRELMLGPALEFNRPGLERGLPGYVASLEERLAAAPPAELDGLRRRLQDARSFLEQKKAVRHVLPDLTFTDRLDIHLGERLVRVLHHDRAVTPGDAYLHLPNEKVLITGDLLVNPIPFALSCYPSGWLATLEALDALDAAVIVPGHGEPLRDKELLRATAGVFRELIRQGREARAKGLDPDEARALILPGLGELRRRLTADDPARNDAFGVYVADWFLHRVYDEAAGPLTDAIAPIPPK